ncbi:unnamed protein product [Spirodela intermedia]|uniref:Uncharacterized protein n=1 Tax=Spirodela intermedia TaxID=51605 RepID=A0A7I8I7D4_SPIIN|nr:unnamed protein product [Spirodela intermedia]CAA6653475.1 unnamed protein product [Spirodela intermedia]
MELPMARAALDFSRRRRRWLLLLAAAGAAGYGAYRVYHLPAVAEKRRRLAKLLRAMVSLAEAFSASAETFGWSRRTLTQLSKIAVSDEFAGSVSRISEAVTFGVLRGVVASESGSGSKPGSQTESSVAERLLDKLFSTAGSGFASVVVGSFARNLVMALYSAQAEMSTGAASDGGGGAADASSVPQWVSLICDDKFRLLIGDCIQGCEGRRGEIAGRGAEVMRYVTTKSMLSVTVCLALCLHLFSETRVLVLHSLSISSS